MSDPLLEFEDLTIEYQTNKGSITAVSDASFSIAGGEYFGLAGESGSGKSTIAKAVMGGLDDNGRVTSGKIRYNGEEIQDFTEKQLNEQIRWKEISWIPQSSMNSLDPLKRVSEQAIEIGKRHTDFSEDKILSEFAEMFEIVGIQESRLDDYPHQFSGGMQQRAIIALALFLKPNMIIADEPTTALDVLMQDQIFAHLEDIRDELGLSAMIITHDISLIFEACNSMALMHAGQVAETGPVVDVYKSPRHPYAMLFQNAFPDVRWPDRELEVIEGHPPQMKEETDFCSFVDRCPWATEECHSEAPPLEPISNEGNEDHKAACFHKERAYKEYEAERDEPEPKEPTSWL